MAMAMARLAGVSTCFLLLLLAWTCFDLAHASLPPVQCHSTGCTVVNAFQLWPDRGECRFSKVVYPASEKELVAAVAAAVRAKSKVRLVSKWAHSVNKLVCPGGDQGVLISTRDYNRSVHVDLQAGTATIDAGVMLKDLVEILADKGVALSHTPGWSGVSIAGLLSTGAHGSSLWGKGSAVHEHVTAVRIVVPATAAEGYAAVKTFSAATPEELAASKVSLGVLGAVSQVTLEVEPLFKRSLTFDVTSDHDLEGRLFQVAAEQEFPDVSWRASLGSAKYRLDNRVPVTTAGDGSYVEPLFRPTPVAPVLASRAADLALEASRNEPGKCAAAAAGLQAGAAAGFGAANNRSSGQFLGYPVIGFTHHLEASGECSNGPTDVDNPANPLNLVCAGTDLVKYKGASFYSVALSVSLTSTKALLGDIRTLVKKRPLAFCGLDSALGFYIRFIKGNSSAYLGKTEDSVDVDMVFLRADDARTPRLDEDVLEEVEQMLIFKYHGLPHWGKNRPIAFQGVAAKYPRLKHFLKVKEKLDPHSLFSNEWTDAVLGIRGKVSEVKPFCALEGLCICSKDEHCSTGRLLLSPWIGLQASPSLQIRG